MTSNQQKEFLWLRDLRQAIQKIYEQPKFAEGLKAFHEDEYFRVWVLYHIERIGECASRLRRDHNYDAKQPEIDWAGAQGMRRRQVHRYWETDHTKVWDCPVVDPTLQ